MTALAVEPLALVPPAFHTGPQWEFTRGAEVSDFSDALGFVLDPEQRLALDVMYACTGAGTSFTTMQPRWVAMEMGLIAPRQNLKTGVLKPSVLADCLILGAPAVVWSAHRRKTVMRSFKDIEKLIEANAWLSRYVRHVHRSMGNEAIEFTNGSRIDFVVRSEANFRGESNAKIVVDEGLYFTAAQRQALQPTMAAVPNPLIVIASSPGLEESEELRAVRDRGRKGDPTLSYVEWASTKKCAESKCRHELDTPGCVADDEAEWAKSNPALHRRISVEFLRATRRSMATRPEKFLIEHMGHWPDGGRSAVISVIRWTACGAEDVIAGPVAVAVDVALDRSQSWIAVCGATASGVPQVEIAETRPGADWVGEVVEQILSDFDVVAVGARSRGAVTSLLPELRALCEDTPAEFRKVSTGEAGGMCGLFFDRVRDGAVKHRNDARVLPALKAARKHKLADAWEWEREGVDVDAAPLVALTAAHGLFYALKDSATTYDPLANIW